VGIQRVAEDDFREDFKFKLRMLDEAHARARTPKQRRRIERKIEALHKELAKLVEAGEKLDRSFQRWVASVNPGKGNA
jgi:hypothetical protein